jgi:hypothetical protein
MTAAHHRMQFKSKSYNILRPILRIHIVHLVNTHGVEQSKTLIHWDILYILYADSKTR